MYLLHGTTLNTARDLLQGNFVYHKTAWKIDDGRASDPNAVYFRTTNDIDSFFQELIHHNRGEVPNLAIRGMFYYALTDAFKERYGHHARDVAVICFELDDSSFKIVREQDECSLNPLFGDDPNTCKISNKNLIDLYQNNILVPHSMFVYSKIYLPAFRDEYLLYMDMQNQWIPDEILISDHFLQVKERHEQMGYGQLETTLFNSAINQCYFDNNFQAYKFIIENEKLVMKPLNYKIERFNTNTDFKGNYINSYHIVLEL